LPDLMKRVKTAEASDPSHILSNANTSVNVIEVLPRINEGGAFVKFTHDVANSPQEVEKAVKDYIKLSNTRPWYNQTSRMKVNLVKGRPWVEDLARLPTSRLRVEFLPPQPDAPAVELTEEQLYSFFRPYGKLANIITQPSDSKILPKFAILEFATTRRAIMAKNCMHGFKVPEADGGGKLGTLLKCSYEQKPKPHWIRDWIFGHPRIVIPIVAAIVAGITVAIFDPIRTWFIKMHITGAFHLSDYRVIRWLRAQTTDILRFRRRNYESRGLDVIWDDRKENIEQIQTWLMESADTFIIVQGPRGSGKRELVVDQALKNRKNTVVIDSKPIQEARGDSATICAAAAQVGYRPVLSWMNTVSGWIDLAAQGTTGVKTGFSETLDTQLGKIWNNTASALRQIALEGRRKDDKDAQLTDDEYLEAHPERRPIVVIDNFLHKSQESTVVYDKLAEWAALLTTANIAHVIFLTHDVSFSKSLSKALPDRVFRQLSLSDCTTEAAKRFVISHLDADANDAMDPNEKNLTPSQKRADLDELDSSLSVLGGRLTDLEFLARRIKTGEAPSKAVGEIVEQSASEILKMYIYGGGEEARKWNTQQAWLLIKQLAAADDASLRYNEVLLSDTFKTGGDAVLQALEQAELIAISSFNGRPMGIKPGKPVYHAAFRRLTEDSVLKAKLDLAILTEQIKFANEDIAKYEAELKLLGELPRQPNELVPRIRWLLGKVAASQAKVDGFEKQAATLKKVLAEEY